MRCMREPSAFMMLTMGLTKFDESQVRLTAYMRSKGLKVTRQREEILRTFIDVGKHVGIEELLSVATTGEQRLPGCLFNFRRAKRA